MYKWASNPAKVERAVKVLKSTNQVVNEDAVLALYKVYGGLVLEEHLKPIDIVIETKDETIDIEVTPKKKGRPSTK